MFLCEMLRFAHIVSGDLHLIVAVAPQRMENACDKENRQQTIDRGKNNSEMAMTVRNMRQYMLSMSMVLQLYWKIVMIINLSNYSFIILAHLTIIK